MELQNLSRWHWVIVGLLVGLGLGFAYSNWDGTEGRISVAPEPFQRDLLRQERRAENDPPVIRNVVLNVDADGVYYATFEQINLAKLAYGSFVIKGRTPWPVTHPNGTDLQRGETVADLHEYLEQVKAANPDFDYHYAWWNEARFVYPIWTVGAVVLIGGVWPTVINLMIGAGFAPPRKPKEKKIKPTASKPEPAPPAKPQVDEAEIAAVAAAYEQRLAAGASEGDAAVAGDQPAAEPIRQLDGGPVEPIPVPHNPEDDEPKEFVGEFYPVVKTTHKKDSTVAGDKD